MASSIPALSFPACSLAIVLSVAEMLGGTDGSSVGQKQEQGEQQRHSRGWKHWIASELSFSQRFSRGG